VIEALAAGILFGLSAGLAPGPLLALTISQTLRHGLRAGVRVALAPLITDLPIVTISLLLVGAIAGAAGPLAGIALAGAAFLSWLAWDTWHAEPPRVTAAAGDGEPAGRSWSRGAIANALSPHPWLFWTVVGAPTLLGAFATGGLASAGAFVLGFYTCLVGSKVVVATAVARARRHVVGPGYRWVMRVLAVLLAVFAAGLVVEAWRLFSAG
jgi:threonine/homoserine/homoserine lactone efflux protein